MTPLHALDEGRTELCRWRAEATLAAAPGVVAAVVPGGRSAEQIRANAASMAETIPAAFWEALKREALIAADAPLPG